jgi:sRNA-binding carbon storage regulator CsrA
MLVISRKENESIRLEPAPGIDPALTLAEAFQSGAIVVKLMRVGARRVRLAIEAPAALRVLRDQRPDAAALARPCEGEASADAVRDSFRRAPRAAGGS